MKKVFIVFILVFGQIDAFADTYKPTMRSKVGAINNELPIHKIKKLNPEFSDPVLGDQVQILEWAWSPQYADRFGQKVQHDGLPNGDLWLLGVKVEREQFQNRQRYVCSVIGLMNNKLPIITPPTDIYLMHPDSPWIGGMPGVKTLQALKIPNTGSFSPAVASWSKSTKNKIISALPERGISFPYKYYYKFFQQDLAYFEWQAGCASFNNPDHFLNEIRFPTRIDGKNDADKKIPAVFEKSAIRFDIPDGLMHRIYPYIVEAEDWSSCLMTRIEGNKFGLTERARKSNRFGDLCRPPLRQ